MSIHDMMQDDDRELLELNIDLIKADPDQDRWDWDNPDTVEHINSLAESIADRGIDDPVKVRPLDDGGYKLIDGECRYRAAIIAKVSVIPAISYSALDDKQASAMMLSTQANKLALKPIAFAKALQRRLDSGWTIAELKHATGKSDAWISKRLSLLKLPEEVQQLAVDGVVIDPDNLKKVGKVSDDELSEVVAGLRDGSVSVKDLKPSKPEGKPKKKAAKSNDKQTRTVSLGDAKLILSHIHGADAVPDSDDDLLDMWDEFLGKLKQWQD
ncbi:MULTISPECIES: ParB/RepB/Spo0J family partition protein [Methylophaga]|uniref:ParB/RepB/Spo0J family partition protein n=1 Tax=Methylophaga TaxID=40222 RepID=UPI000CDBF7F9|nr:ParB/RepB/Spo0J family partition protein [Methylophaga nitratireducenticrescens]AUZ86156.1 hypothetical protein CDW43_16000 [Methylophaga nitratireducenticrescens]